MGRWLTPPPRRRATKYSPEGEVGYLAAVEEGSLGVRVVSPPGHNRPHRANPNSCYGIEVKLRWEWGPVKVRKRTDPYFSRTDSAK
jgi:hypothetical protein